MTAACILLVAALSACASERHDATIERVLALEAKLHALEESLEAAQEENAALKSELAALRQEQTDFLQRQEAAVAAEEHKEEVADFEEGQEEQLAALEEGQARNDQRFDDLDSRLRELEAVAAQVELLLPVIETWFKGKDEGPESPEAAELEMTAGLVEEAGGEVHYIGHPAREDRAILVTPPDAIEGEIPLIVSLHGYGGNSAAQSMYLPLHRRVNTDGFALLLPNGTRDSEGNRFWNPTDQCCDGGKSGEDDAAYLTELIATAREVGDFGPVYFFGYSNGGFMAYWMACQGLPGLRAVASLAGTSYMDDAACEGAAPVSVLHIHGTDDAVILFDGDETKLGRKGDGKPVFYAGAEEMVTRWAARAGCGWPDAPEPYALLNFDRYVPGPETQAYRLEPGCAEGINIELWVSEGSGHSPGYGDAFMDALLDWLLAQR